MSYWQYEKMAEDRREEIRREMEQIRLVQKALSNRSNWYARRMFNLGNWMIAWGKRLKARYDSLPAEHTRPIRRGYAR